MEDYVCHMPDGCFAGPKGYHRFYRFNEPVCPAHRKSGWEPPVELFSKKSEGLGKALDMLPQAAGDDPRPTEKIRADLKALGIDMPENAVRKELWAKWRSIKQAELVGQRYMVKRHTQGPKQAGSATKSKAPPTQRKLFCEMTPDDVNNMTAREMVAILAEAPYNHQMSPSGVAKTDIQRKGIELEKNLGLFEG